MEQRFCLFGNIWGINILGHISIYDNKKVLPRLPQMFRIVKRGGRSMGEGRNWSVGKSSFRSRTKELLGWRWRRLERPEAVLWFPRFGSWGPPSRLGQSCAPDLAAPSRQGPAEASLSRGNQFHQNWLELSSVPRIPEGSLRQEFLFLLRTAFGRGSSAPEWALIPTVPTPVLFIFHISISISSQWRIPFMEHLILLQWTEFMIFFFYSRGLFCLWVKGRHIYSL